MAYCVSKTEKEIGRNINKEFLFFKHRQLGVTKMFYTKNFHNVLLFQKGLPAGYGQAGL